MQTASEVAARHAAHIESVSPGQPARMVAGLPVGDAVAQGDLIITVIDAIPEGYAKVEQPTDADRQLAPEDGSPGSHHRLASFDGATLWRRADWGVDPADLRGPVLVVTRELVVVRHERQDKPHGPVTLEPGIYGIQYQRNLDVVTKQERRARD